MRLNTGGAQPASFIIDFDSTIVTVESLDELAAIALRGREDRGRVIARLQEITDLGMAGKLPFDESLARRLALFAPSQAHLHELTTKLIHCITPSFWENREWLARNADRIFVISGGFEECIVPVIIRLGLKPEHVLANSFIVDGRGRVVGHDAERYLSQAGGKVRQVEALGLGHPVTVIGDGYTDYEIRASGLADSFWYFAENVIRPNVREKADKVAESFNDIVREFDTQGLVEA